MSRYIVFPKEESVARNIIEPPPVATPVFRDPIVEHFKGVFEKDPEHELLLRVFTESIRRVPLLGDQPKIQSNEITGISVIEGPDELAKEMENRLSNYYLIKRVRQVKKNG
jgi:hypothetical protein